VQRKIITTNDGSTSIHMVEWNEQYHSKHGAIQEAKHVFIESGLVFFLSNGHGNFKPISILEIGFGTGLNAYITLLEAQKRNIKINYNGVDAFPVSKQEIQQLNFESQLGIEKTFSLFSRMHELPWEEEFQMTDFFSLKKQQKYFSEINNREAFNLIYFDAFGPRVQPELWTESLFQLMFNALKVNGVLVTYCAQGNARRALQKVGFIVEKIVGPPGKRHMIRALKSNI